MKGYVYNGNVLDYKFDLTKHKLNQIETQVYKLRYKITRF